QSRTNQIRFPTAACMRKGLPLFGFIGLAAAFVFGLFQIFQVRFEAGDVYPEYSSLRSDPLGTMAFCESLQAMPGLTVRRDFTASNQLPFGKDTVYLHLAARTLDWSWLDEEQFKEIERFLTSGGRLAISFYPELAK